MNDIASKSRAKNLPSNGESDNTRRFTTAQFNDENADDWRVSLSVPTTDPNFKEENIRNGLLSPLREIGNRMVFPYTPNIYITHNANYDTMEPVHNNYPFQIYQNSNIDAFTITGDFSVENEEEGRFWVASVHYLRSVTKMAYGESTNKGAPPPVVRLNGYGSYVFNQVPVVVKSFNIVLQNDVDYIQTTVLNEQTPTWVPTESEIAVTVVPAYSRSQVNRFNLGEFVRSGYIGSNEGFI